MLYLIILIVILLLFPYISLLVKRLSLLIRVKRLCKKRNISFKRLSGGILLSSIKNGKISFICESEKSVLSVKVCGTISRRVFLRFIDTTHYATRNLRFQLSSTSGAINYETHNKDKYDFKEGLSIESFKKKLIPVILVCPVPASVSTTSGSETKSISQGDNIGEGYYYSSDGFLKLLSEI